MDSSTFSAIKTLYSVPVICVPLGHFQHRELTYSLNAWYLDKYLSLLQWSLLESCSFNVSNLCQKSGATLRFTRSTQPSAFCGMVKWVSAFGLSNNKMAMVSVVNWQPTGGLMVQADRLCPKVGGHLAPCCAHRVNQGELSQCCYSMMTAP